MNTVDEGVWKAARELTVEILSAIGVKSEEMESYFGEASAGSAIELQLTRFAGAILEQAKTVRPPKTISRTFEDVGCDCGK